MAAKEQYTVDLNPAQYDFLQDMMKKYDIQDESKTLRCLIDFAFQESQHQDDIFSEIRCHHC